VKFKPVRGQLSVFLVLAVLTVLSLGGAAWSAFTGPKVAEVQLQEAAANTVAAPSLVADIQLSIKLDTGSLGGSGLNQNGDETISEDVDYQAPDRLSGTTKDSGTGAGGVSSTSATLTQIGSSCWSNPAGDSDSECDKNPAADFFEPVSGLEKAPDVTDRDGTYYLSPAASEAVVNGTTGQGGTSLSVPASDYSVEARISGDTISWEQLTVKSSSESGNSDIDIVVTFSQVGSAPPVRTPAGPPTSRG
jgi:hypothetical protein